MTAVLLLATIVVLPAAAAGVLSLFCRWLTGGLRPRKAHVPPVVEPARRPIEQVAADIRRLADQCARIPAGAPRARRRGVQAAYDDVLAEGALLLGVPHALAAVPAGAARDRERMRLEAALVAAGLVIRR